jgi:arylsulfatase A-like enzyme
MRTRRGVRTSGAAFVAAALLTGCGGAPEPPRWTSLARAFRPRDLLALAQGWQRAAGLDPARCEPREWHVRVEHTLRRTDWERGAAADTWTSAFPGGAFDYATPGFVLARAGEELLPWLEAGAQPGPNTLHLEGRRIVLCTAPGAEPPAETLLVVRLEDGRETSDHTWQVRVGNDERDGLTLWSGLAEELAAPLPAASQLSCEWRFLSLFPGAVTLRVRVDGELALETTADAAQLATEGRWLHCALPGSARRSARFSFEIEGPPGQGLLFHPVIGPAAIGRPDARPWAAPRPDIVVLLADTFRADSLAHAGGDPTLTPTLNALAASALRFTHAHSNAAWTLPSIGALLTGLSPGQHTANTNKSKLPGDLVTIAESLSVSGYRTGAVTDSAFFAPSFGLDQGFESFVANPTSDWDIDWTARQARAFLARDDGRPVFLVVHSYRTHNPYRVGPEEDIGPWRALLASGCVLIKSKGQIPREEWRQRLANCRERYAALYREGVRDLDRGFGEVLAAVEASGVGAGFVFLTADHGEALGENDDIFHDGKLWESKLHIPLVVRGPGLAPRDVAPVVTLLDLAPTFAALAGLPADPRWSGSSILAVTSERPACAFLMKQETQVSLLENGHKLYAADLGAFARGEFDAAYDLVQDPREEHPVTGESWPGELARRRAGFVRALLEPAAKAVEVPLSSAQQQELDRLGYGGDHEDR